MKLKTREKLNTFFKIGAGVLAAVILVGYLMQAFFL